MEKNNNNKHSAEFYDAISHPIRIEILEALNKGALGFADLKRAVGVVSSGNFTFHLEKLGTLIGKDEYGNYCLSGEGKKALLSLPPIEKYTENY